VLAWADWLWSIAVATSRELRVEEGFPSQLAADAETVVRILPPPTPFGAASLDVLEVTVDGEIVRIPFRIYLDKVPDRAARRLGDVEMAIVHCLYTRHNDGFVRERHLRQILPLPHAWVVPYVVQLIGEYVVELLHQIQVGLGTLGPSDRRHDAYSQFVRANPGFVDLTAARVASYWNCYYRFDYPKTKRLRPNKSDYPGFQLIELLRSIA
jgi:hypothetical protein